MMSAIWSALQQSILRGRCVSSYCMLFVAGPDTVRYYRTTKQKRFALGVLHLIRYTITMLTESRQIINQSPKPSELCRNHCGTWSYNAKNEWISWKHFVRAGRRLRRRRLETGQAVVQQCVAGLRCQGNSQIQSTNILLHRGLERIQCPQ